MCKVDEHNERRAEINYVNSRCSYDAALSLTLPFFPRVELRGTRREENWRDA